MTALIYRIQVITIFNASVKGIEYLERHGKDVEEKKFVSVESAMDEVMKLEKTGGHGFETAAVLTMTEEEAKACYEHLKKTGKEVSYIDRDSTKFKKGLTVTTFYQAKGLEFDQVFVTGGDKDNPFYTQYQYIAATRALHELYVYEVE